MTNGPDFTKRDDDGQDDPTVFASPVNPSEPGPQFGDSGYSQPPQSDPYNDPFGQPAVGGNPYGSPAGGNSYGAPGVGGAADPFGAPAYGAPSGYGYPVPAVPQSSGMALASMILGILSIPFLILCGTGVIFAILALIFGYISRGQIQRSQGQQTGLGRAQAGIITAYVTLGLFVLLVIVRIIQVSVS